MGRFGFLLARPSVILSRMVGGRRAATLFVERWQEQLRTTFVPRRTRTLSSAAALEELLSLAEGYVRSGGSTRPAVDPDEGGHGVHMLSDVAEETADLLAHDELLGARYPQRKAVLQSLVSRMKAKEHVTQDAVAELRALAIPLRSVAVSASFERVLRLVEAEPKEHQALCSLSNAIVSELRALGWSDEALQTAGAAAELALPADHLAALGGLRDAVIGSIREFVCYVAVALPANRPPFPEDEPTLSVAEELPRLERTGRPPKSGPYLRAVVHAFDTHGAAAAAHRRVLSTLGALTVFLPGSRIEVASDIVAVEEPSRLRMVELNEGLVGERRKPDKNEQARILRSAWTASGSRVADPLHDALRLRHRALQASDSESRLLLLWSSIERMTAGARGYAGALSAARELVSQSVTLGKLRREIGDLIACVQHAIAKHADLKARLIALAGVDDERRRGEIDRVKILQQLLGDKEELRKLTEIVYEVSPLLAYRCHDLWKSFGSGATTARGSHMAAYFERSRARVARQVCRIYRARNRIAHVGAGAERVRDLVWHAHFYLTQLMAICVHYTESRQLPAQEVLSARTGQYRAFIELLKSNDPEATSAEVLLRPVRLVGDPR